MGTGRKRAKPRAANILIIDDNDGDIVRLRQLLEQDGHAAIRHESDPWKAVDTVSMMRPDVVLVNLDMPALDGFGVMQLLTKETGLDQPVPTILMVKDISDDIRRHALDVGVFDIITKPLQLTQVTMRVRNALEIARVRQEFKSSHHDLEAKVKARTDELEEAQLQLLARLGRAAEYRDDDTGDHTRHVGTLSGRLAEALGVSLGITDMIQRAAPLHDVGKIAIPDKILLKPGPLDPEEMEIMKSHTAIGAEMLSGNHPLLWLASQIALTHHERWNGEGYPQGLRGEDIPLPGRIVAVADVFDTMTRDRHYRKAWTRQQAVTEIMTQREKQFDPRVVQSFVDVMVEDLAEEERQQAG
jgi:putative two-component system response regulator